LHCLPKIRVPKLRIEGTQRPTNKPSSLLPENHSETENRNDAPAAMTKPSFAILNLLMINPLLSSRSLRTISRIRKIAEAVTENSLLKTTG